DYLARGRAAAGGWPGVSPRAGTVGHTPNGAGTRGGPGSGIPQRACARLRRCRLGSGVRAPIAARGASALCYVRARMDEGSPAIERLNATALRRLGHALGIEERRHAVENFELGVVDFVEVLPGAVVGFIFDAVT